MFALGAGPVPGLLLPEIFPSRIRAKAMAICMSVHWVIFPFFGGLILPSATDASTLKRLVFLSQGASKFMAK